ncbi:hypothetical protein F3J17_22855 [Burkholderia sp. Ax-1719]|nr:hypothetical protein [Burkholderia sp. Ax-1719]
MQGDSLLWEFRYGIEHRPPAPRAARAARALLSAPVVQRWAASLSLQPVAPHRDSVPAASGIEIELNGASVRVTGRLLTFRFIAQMSRCPKVVL